MYRKDFFLTQHTPLIHFENLENATIRPTELKSKLDKFLMDKCKDLNVGDPKNKDDLIEFKTNYRYKVFVKVKKVKIDEIIERKEGKEKKKDKKLYELPFYFGNGGRIYKQSPKVLSDTSSTGITVSFFSFNKTLLDCIESSFEAFLASTNFGTRQSKGYGSFYLADKEFNPNLIDGFVYKLRINESDWNKALKDVDLFYRFLRQGINRVSFNKTKESRITVFYCKPAVFSYVKKIFPDIEWEKRVIKQNFFSDTLVTQAKNYPYSDVLKSGDKKRDIRDIFGLSSNERWFTYSAYIKKIDQSGKIKRFKSPITIKPIKVSNGFDVYFFMDWRKEERLDEFLGTSLKIEAKGKLIDCKPFKIKVLEDFDFDDFFRYVSGVKLDEYVEKKYHGHGDFGRLKEMLNNFEKVK